MTNIPDNSKYERMIKNRPNLSIVPKPNKRLISQMVGRSLFINAAFMSAFSILVFKGIVNFNSLPFMKTRKNFVFETDPYSGEIKCKYNDVPYVQHEF